MASRDEIRVAVQGELKWVIVGNGPEPRSEADMRAIIDWIDRAVDAWLLNPDSDDGAMLQALRDGLFTITAVTDGEPQFQLTEYGRTRADTMPHDPRRLTPDGIRGPNGSVE